MQHVTRQLSVNIFAHLEEGFEQFQQNTNLFCVDMPLDVHVWSQCLSMQAQTLYM